LVLRPDYRRNPGKVSSQYDEFTAVRTCHVNMQDAAFETFEDVPQSHKSPHGRKKAAGADFKDFNACLSTGLPQRLDFLVRRADKANVPATIDQSPCKVKDVFFHATHKRAVGKKHDRCVPSGHNRVRSLGHLIRSRDHACRSASVVAELGSFRAGVP
jgi:hypothetical protein